MSDQIYLLFFLWQEIDLRIGASFTRFQTMLLRDAFVIESATNDRNLVLSYGPCQVWEFCIYHLSPFLIQLSTLMYAFLLFVPFMQYSSLHLDLLWNDIGRYSRMSRRNFGPLTVHTDQMKALLHSIGCKVWRLYVLLSSFSNHLKFYNILDLQAWTFFRLHLCCYNLWDVCWGTYCYCESCWVCVYC